MDISSLLSTPPKRDPPQQHNPPKRNPPQKHNLLQQHPPQQHNLLQQHPPQCKPLQQAHEEQRLVVSLSQLTPPDHNAQEHIPTEPSPTDTVPTDWLYASDLTLAPDEQPTPSDILLKSASFFRAAIEIQTGAKFPVEDIMEWIVDAVYILGPPCKGESHQTLQEQIDLFLKTGLLNPPKRLREEISTLQKQNRQLAKDLADAKQQVAAAMTKNLHRQLGSVSRMNELYLDAKKRLEKHLSECTCQGEWSISEEQESASTKLKLGRTRKADTHIPIMDQGSSKGRQLGNLQTNRKRSFTAEQHPQSTNAPAARSRTTRSASKQHKTPQTAQRQSTK